jgi:hypothetical protein
MSVRKSVAARGRRAFRLATLASIAVGLSLPVWAGGNRVSAVGGVMVDVKGILTNATTDDTGNLRKVRLEALQAVPADLNAPTELRMVSLRRLEQAIAEQDKKTAARTDDIKYLAGLQRVQYVFVYPELNDIVLAGPAEGWKIDDRGNVVGVNTGRPVLLLDDLLVALRTAEAAANGGISCSIDPTQEGLNRLQNFLNAKQQAGPAVISGIEENLGMQTITITGVPATSHFARVLVAADFKMKRLAMNFDKSPVKGMPSFLQMIGNGKLTNMMPRWWLTTNYESLLKDPDGLAWEIRGPGVRAMTEDELIGAGGTRQQTGRSNPVAQQWADTMTAKYEELSLKDPIFGELRNVMDLALVAALIAKEGLRETAGFEMALLLDGGKLNANEFEAPKQVQSMASVLKKRGGWLVSVSGGVEALSWQAAEKQEVDDGLSSTHQKAAPSDPARWWWN